MVQVSKSLLLKVKTYNILLCVLLCTIVASGCGFQLRGDYLLAPELQTMFVSSVDKHGEFTRELTKQLKLNQVKVVRQLSSDIPEMRILKDSLDRRTLSVFPNGQVAEYEIIYTVRYELRFSNKDPLPFSFEINRDYQDDPDNALAKSRELALMLSEMRQEAAARVLRNMASIQP